MKILHINTLSNGGAANAAIRLHEGLLQNNIHSTFLTLSQEPNEIENHLIFPQFSKFGLSLSKRIKNKVGVKSLKGIKRKSDFEQFGHPIECFSSPESDYKLAEYINNELDIDIVNLHWVANFIDYKEFFSTIRKPVVWTLHDQNPFASYWHYSNDHILSDAAQPLHSEYLNTKQVAIASTTFPVHIVSPSQWLLNESKSSNTFTDLPHHHIQYSLDTNIFTFLSERPDSYLDFKQDENETIGLFICQSIDNKRKGMNLLMDAMKQIPAENNLRFIAIGAMDENSRAEMPDNIYFTGTIKDENELARLYNLADFTIIPSLQDNLPNTMLESLCCGTPVIGTPAGGIPEIISQNNFGIVANDFSANALLESIYAFQNGKSKFDRMTIGEKAQNQFASHIQAEKYAQLYNSILS